MRLLLFVIPLLAGCAAPTVQATQAPSDANSGRVCTLQTAAVTESSGIALSRRATGIYWTHNDSGDGPNLYAFDADGRDCGVYTLKGATAIDWEDMASAMIDGKPFLFVADVGDNARTRATITVHRIPEPEIEPGRTEIADFETFTLSYPDGPHDCETLLVTPSGGIQVVTKTQDGVCGVYSADLSGGSEVLSLKKIGELRLTGSVAAMRMATAGDMSEDGKRVVIRTYSSAYFYKGTSIDWFTKTPKSISIPFEGQSEGICFDFDPTRAITTSEGTPCRANWTLLPN